MCQDSKNHLHKAVPLLIVYEKFVKLRESGTQDKRKRNAEDKKSFEVLIALRHICICLSKTILNKPPSTRPNRQSLGVSSQNSRSPSFVGKT